MSEFIVAFRKSPESEGIAQLYADGPDSLRASNENEFYYKFLRYFDDLNHLKYLDHIRFIDAGVESSEKNRWASYVATGKRALRDLRSSLGESEDSLMGLRNILGNIGSILKYPSSDLLKVSEPFDAVVVAAGPSLDLEIENLKLIQNRALIISVDASLRTLLEHGIEPHLVACTERGIEVLPFFEKLPANLRTKLVAQGTVTPELFKTYSAEKFVSFKYSSNFLWLPFKRSRHWVGASVAHLCYRLATSMGAKSVALVGQDLAYHPKTLQSHGKVVAYPGWSEGDTFDNRREEFKASYVPGNTIEWVPSNPMWGNFADEYTEIIADAKVSTFNTSQLGRKISGTEFISLSDWMKRLGDKPIQLFRAPDTEANSKVLAQRMLDKIKDAKFHLTGLQSRKDYEGVLEVPHFLELVLEIVITQFVKAENERFGTSGSAAIAAEQNFLSFVSQKIPAILEILADAQSQVDSFLASGTSDQ